MGKLVITYFNASMGVMYPFESWGRSMSYDQGQKTSLTSNTITYINMLAWIPVWGLCMHLLA